MKICLTSLINMEIQIKPLWNATTCLLDYLHLKRLTMPSAGQDVEQLEVSCIALGNKNGTVILESSLTVSYKVI